MPLTISESFKNVKIICNSALMNKTERIAIDESLNNIADTLQAHNIMLEAAKPKKVKPQILESGHEEGDN